MIAQKPTGPGAKILQDLEDSSWAQNNTLSFNPIGFMKQVVTIIQTVSHVVYKLGNWKASSPSKAFFTDHTDVSGHSIKFVALVQRAMLVKGTINFICW